MVSLFANDSIIFAGISNEGAFRSTNNGLNWERSHGGLPNSLISTPQAFIIKDQFVITGCSNNKMFRSSNNGTNWSPIGEFLSNYYNEFLIVENNLFLCTQLFQGISKSTNNGMNWSPSNTGLTNLYVWSLAILGSDIFAGTNYSQMYHSSDLGASWVLLYWFAGKWNFQNLI